MKVKDLTLDGLAGRNIKITDLKEQLAESQRETRVLREQHSMSSKLAFDQLTEVETQTQLQQLADFLLLLESKFGISGIASPDGGKWNKQMTEALAIARRVKGK